MSEQQAAEAIRLEQKRKRIQSEVETKVETTTSPSSAVSSSLEKGKTALKQIGLITQSEIKATLIVQMAVKEANYLRKRDAVLSALKQRELITGLVMRIP